MIRPTTNSPSGGGSGSWFGRCRAASPRAPDMLFNVDQDPGEKTDLAAAHPGLVKSLGLELEAWRALHPKAEIDSSMTPHPGWIPPADYAQAAGYD